LPNKPLIKKAVEQFDKDVLVFSISEIPEDIRIEFVHKITEN
jgi:flagellar biosynthesis component FlhA